MNIIIPMAGKGTRLRPHTLSTPKPLIEIAGKSIIERIIDLVVQKSNTSIQKIGFIIERPDPNIENMFKSILSAKNIDYEVFFQGEARGTAHAIYCAKNMLNGPTLIAFSDTIFDTDLDFDAESDACILVKEVDDPSAFGVVKLNNSGYITDFIEKPQTPISNLAIVGVYYFKNGSSLKKEIENLLDNNIILNGEYQITTALENLKNRNFQFSINRIKSWLDFGNPNNLLASHAEILKQEDLQKRRFPNTTIHEPCYIAPTAEIENSILGPNVSIGAGTIIKSSKIRNSIIQKNSAITGGDFHSSIIGNNVTYDNNFSCVNIGDYCTLK
ncbi:MAG: nucleotidyltransferase [Flavobacteriales bacterium]|nr:nucleotidyltransferase [Flavobacteriales bacterium]|tara:strand:- start:2445 stop:3431 length:987 start_codon:yes stop_codon:yes gene_type:complete